MQTEELGGMGDIKYRELHRVMAQYRFLFSPIRYTSLPLAVIEAMTIGMPVVALATTELPAVIEHGQNGYCSCDLEELRAGMRRLLDDPAEARRLGANARETAHTRFSLDRFARAWNAAFQRAAELAGTSFATPALPGDRELVSASTTSLPQHEEGDAG
jgi:glycosyltransferase involved in cell wall biosynthesis